MSLYHISVKAEPDWAIGSNNGDQNESRNCTDGSTHASDQRVKKENENSVNVDMERAAAESSSSEPASAEVPGEPLRVVTPGYHRRSNWYAKERSSNFSKQECQLLHALIDKYSEIMFNKKTDTATNLKKKLTWVKIAAEFNAVSSNKRTLRQLQAKLDNMKRNRRKKERSEANNLSKVVVIPVLEMPPTNTDSDDRVSLNTTTTDRLSLDTTTTDRLSLNTTTTDRLSLNTTTTDRLSLNTTTTDPLSLDTTPINCVSLDTTTNDCVSPDGLADIDEQVLKSELQIDEVLEPSDEEPHSTAAVIDPLLLECSELRPVPSVPPSPPRVRASPAARRAASLPRFRKRAKPTETERERNQKLRQTKFDAIHCTRKYDRILFETKLQHLEEKRREDRDIYELKKRKLELEISLLEKQNKS